jgi:prepilin-type N-terminal cleavage/methylation domain-containing protein
MEAVTKRQRRSRAWGTTLVELMIVVVILGILAAIATVGYKRYVARARLSEANAMLAELSAKEQLFFMDAGAYVPARADDQNPPVQPSVGEPAEAFIPVSPTAADFESARTPHAVSNPSFPVAWSRIGLRPRWTQLYCTYLVNAGGASQAPTGPIGSQLWATTPLVPWFYVVAACNLSTTDGGSFPDNVTLLVLTSDSPALRTINDGH